MLDLSMVMAPEVYALDDRTRAATEKANTRIDLAWWDRWRDNLLANSDCIRRLPSLSNLFGQWDGARVIVAGAGPSLHRSMKFIGRAQQGGWKLIAADRAFETLVRAGIAPDITVSCDASEKVAEFFPHEILDKNSRFALCVISHPDVYARLSGCDISVFSCANPFSAFWRYAESQCPAGTACLRPGFVVTFSAVDLAQWMGAQEIVTIGNELCWKKENDVEDLYRRAALIRLPDGRVTINAFSRAAKSFAFFPRMFPNIDFEDASGGIASGWRQTDLKTLCDNLIINNHTKGGDTHEME